MESWIDYLVDELFHALPDRKLHISPNGGLTPKYLVRARPITSTKYLNTNLST